MEIITIGDKNIDAFRGLIFGDLMPGRGALGAISDDKPQGAAVFSVNDGICVLEHIFVDPDMRRKGVGTALFEAAKEAFADKGFKSVMTFYERTEETEGFFDSLGFVSLPGIPVYSISCEDILAFHKCEALSEKFKDTGMVTPDKLTLKRKNLLLKQMGEHGFDPSVSEPDGYDKEWSFVYSKDDVSEGVILAKEVLDDIHVSALVSFGGENTCVLRLFAELIHALIKKEHRFGKIRFLGRNKEIHSFLETYLEGKVAIADDGMTMEGIKVFEEKDNAKGI